MNNSERYKQAFGVLHTGATYSTDEYAERKEKRVFRPGRRLVTVCICAALTTALAVTAFANSEQIIRHIFGWGDNLEITTELDESGCESNTVMLHTENLTEPVEFRDGRMIFIVNGESIDITDSVSKTDAFQYEYTDENGNTHLWLVGLNSADLLNYGYAEYMDIDGKWVGYSARVNDEADGSTSAEWLQITKEKMNIP